MVSKAKLLLRLTTPVRTKRLPPAPPSPLALNKKVKNYSAVVIGVYIGFKVAT